MLGDVDLRSADGALAFRNVITESADGRHRLTQYDDDGNGAFDRSQTDDLVINAKADVPESVAEVSLADKLTKLNVNVELSDGRSADIRCKTNVNGCLIVQS